MIKKKEWWRSWPRLMLWANALGCAGFYLTLGWRTRPDENDVATALWERPQDAGSRQTGTPLVSIIVPVRNEEQNIRRCLESLLKQDFDRYEIIVVNDNSTDNTASILEDLLRYPSAQGRLRVISLHDLPRGWAGKPHALHCGTQEAQGEWLLFTDADTWHAPNALRSTVTQAIKEDLALFTLATTQELPTFWERTMMPQAYMGISMLYPPREINDPNSSIAVANGQYLLIRRAVYEQLGGYARPDLRDTLVDDRDLARVVKKHGYRLRFVEGNDLVYVRMYTSFAGIWRGWRKNAFLGNRGGLLFVLIQLIGLPLVTVVPFLLPFFAWMMARQSKRRVGKAEGWVASILALLPLLVYRSFLNRQLGVPQRYSLTHPLAGLLFTGILGESAWRIITRRGVDWRGRQYHQGEN